MAAKERPKQNEQDEPEQSPKSINMQETSSFRVKDNVNLDALLSGNQDNDLDFESDDDEDRVPPIEEDDGAGSEALMDRASRILSSDPASGKMHKSIEEKLAMEEDQIKEESSAKTLIAHTPRPIPPTPGAAPKRTLASTINHAKFAVKKDSSAIPPIGNPQFFDDEELLGEDAPPPQTKRTSSPFQPASGTRKPAARTDDEELLQQEPPPTKATPRQSPPVKPNNYAETVMSPSKEEIIKAAEHAHAGVAPKELNPDDVMASLEKMAAVKSPAPSAAATVTLGEEEIQKNLAQASKPVPPTLVPPTPASPTLVPPTMAPPTPAPMPTATPTVTPTVKPTPIPTPTPTPMPMPTPTPTPPAPNSKPVSFADAFAVHSQEDSLKKPDVMDTAAVLAAVEQIAPTKTPPISQRPMAAAETFIVSPKANVADDLPPFDTDAVLAEVEKMTPAKTPPRMAAPLPDPPGTDDPVLDDDEILAQISKLGNAAPGKAAPVEEPPSDTDDKLLLQATKHSGGKSKIKDFAPEKISPSREYPAVRPPAPPPSPSAAGEIIEDDFSALEDDFSALDQAPEQNAATTMKPSSAAMPKDIPAGTSAPSTVPSKPPEATPPVEDDSDILSKLLKEGGISASELNALNQSASAGSGRETVTFESASKRAPVNAGISEHESIAKTLLKEERGEVEEEEEANEQIIDEIISHAATLKEFSERKEGSGPVDFSSEELTGATMVAPKTTEKASFFQLLFALLLIPWSLIKRLFKKLPRPADYNMTYTEVLGYIGVINIIVAIFLLIVWKYTRWIHW